MIVLLIATGVLSGMISGMGIGGGTLLIPALVMLTDISQQQVQNVNLLYFIPTAVVALITHVKEGNIEKGGLKTIIGFGILGAVAGAMVAVGMDSGLLRKLFGGFLLLMGVAEFLKKDKS